MTRTPLWSRVQQGDSSSCWPWLGSRTRGGYGTTGRTTAHREAYRLANGPIPTGHVVMHTCDNPPCCNPAHLRTGTQRDNLADVHAKGRAGDCRNFGEAHGRSKLTDAQVAEIRHLRAGGMTQQALADRFGVGQTQISRIVRGENRVIQRIA